jgi:hypothetical protein
VASKIAAETGGAACLAFAWLWALGESAGGAGFGDEGAAWAATSAAPQTAIQTPARTFNRKAPPNLFLHCTGKG